MNLLRYVLEGESKASLKWIDARAMDPAALDDVAHQWAHRGDFERALALLEPLFDAGTKPPRHAELLLDTLFDIWPPDHTPQRRRRLAERLAKDSNPKVACVALHRCIVMLADGGCMEEAWVRFHDGIRQYPEDVNFAAVELMLLLREDRVGDAKRRAEFWVHRLRRMGTEFHPFAERLMSMVESRDDHDGLDQLRAESPLIDSLARLIEAQPIRTDGYRPRPAEIDMPIVLTPGSALAATERRWSEALGVDEPSMLTFDSDKELLGPEQILTMLEQDPALMHSFDVLDDISESLDASTNEWAELGVVLELVLQRAETMLLAIVTGRAPTGWVTANTWRDALEDIVHVVPWGFMENRPALRLMARHIDHLKYRNVGNVNRWMPRAQILLRINPNDNHGYRELVSTELLRQRHPTDALALLNKYPDDAMGAVCMNRVLALFLLDRHVEAEIFLRKGGTWLREMRKGITQDRYAKPRDALEDSIIIGGRDEAWIYRQEMLTSWKEVRAIDWLKQQPSPRKSRRRKANPVDTGPPEASGGSGMSIDEEFKPPADVSEDSPAKPSPLSHQALQACIDDLAPHGEWLLGLTLAAALTPGGGFDLKRLFNPVLERLGNDNGSGDDRVASGASSDSVDYPNENALEDSESIVLLNRTLDHFLRLYQHFCARFDGPSTLPEDTVSDASASDAAGVVKVDALLNWVAKDLSVVSLDETESRLELVKGLVAGIDGNPRGWSPIPTGPRNNVIGPFRLMVASAGELPDSADSALANVTLLDPDDSTFQMNREECLVRIKELVRLARLARQ